MRRAMCSATCAIVFGLAAWDGRTPGLATVAAAGDPHAYFNALIARGDFYKGYSLRPAAGVSDPANPYYVNQLANRDSGGLHASGSCPPAFTYSPRTDSDPHRQDAAKSPIHAFEEPGVCKGHPLTVAMSASSSGANEKITLSAVTSTYGPPGKRQLQIENEILNIRPCTVAEGGDGVRGYIAATKRVCVIRGAYGTTAAAHSVGIKPKASTNSINNHLSIPIGTSDGNTYLITWDSYWTDSYLQIGPWDTGQKAFQFTNSSDNKLFEPKLKFAATREPGFNATTDIGVVNARAYNSIYGGQATWVETNGNTMGPGFGTDSATLSPRAGTFVIKPNVWTRWWVRVEQRANDWDYFDIWVADENTNPVLVYGRIPLSVSGGHPNAQSIARFWFEQNNSNPSWLRGDLRDLVSYHRNWAVLRNPPDVPRLLLRPLTGVPPQFLRNLLLAPRNVRIVP